MSLHGLLSVTIGVPNVEQTAAYYADFGLAPGEDNWFAPPTAAVSCTSCHAATRRLVELRVGADDADDLARTAASLARLGLPGRARRDGAGHRRAGHRHASAGRDRAPAGAGPGARPTPYNGPGRVDRPDARAPGFMRRPGCARASWATPSFGSTDHERQHVVLHRRPRASRSATGSRARARSCAARPTTTTCSSWRAGELPAPHVLAGRRHRRGGPRRRTRCSTATPSGTSGASAGTTPGSNFFWYLKDPAGNFSSTTPTWTASSTTSSGRREDLEGARGLFCLGTAAAAVVPAAG